MRVFALFWPFDPHLPQPRAARRCKRDGVRGELGAGISGFQASFAGQYAYAQRQSDQIAKQTVQML
ncbi:MAG: hypothetical protein ACI92Z_003460 [Paracoccaceae bacterium]|jgi:hypothetical protein